MLLSERRALIDITRKIDTSDNPVYEYMVTILNMKYTVLYNWRIIWALLDFNKII